MQFKKIALLCVVGLSLLTLSACNDSSTNATGAPVIETTSAATEIQETTTQTATQQETPETETEATAEPEPYYFDDFVLYTLDGEETSLYAYEGQIILLNFWATWCPYCVDEMPLLDAINERDDVVVLAIDVGEDQKTVTNYLDDNDYSFEVFLDESGELAGTFGVTGLPMTVFMGPDFEYYYVQRSMLDQNALDAIMEAIDAL